MLFPDIFGPESKQNGDAVERRVLFATKKSGEKMILQKCNQGYLYSTHTQTDQLENLIIFFQCRVVVHLLVSFVFKTKL
jgi:hypothetical protein